MNGPRRYRAGATLLALASCAAVVGLAGCGGSDSTSNSAPPSIAPSTSGTTHAATPTTSGASGAIVPPSASHTASADDLLKVGQKALQQVSGGTVTSIDSERGGTAWEVKVVSADGTEHELQVSGDGSKVISGPSAKPQSDADKKKHLDRVNAAKLDYKAAANRVLAAVPNGKITELDLDTYQGKTVWEADAYVDISSRTKHEVKIDASSGAVIANNSG